MFSAKCPHCGLKISAFTQELVDRSLAAHIKRGQHATRQPQPEPESSAIFGIGGINVAEANEMPTVPRQAPKQRDLVHCDCGHDVPAAWVMSASLGTSCPDCYDRMSD